MAALFVQGTLVGLPGEDTASFSVMSRPHRLASHELSLSFSQPASGCISNWGSRDDFFLQWKGDRSLTFLGVCLAEMVHDSCLEQRGLCMQLSDTLDLHHSSFSQTHAGTEQIAMDALTHGRTFEVRYCGTEITGKIKSLHGLAAVAAKL